METGWGKLTFTEMVKPEFQRLGYVKRGNYWHKSPGNGLIYSVMVSGSQWNQNDYYVEMGITVFDGDHPFPTQLHWTLFLRCVSDGKQMNLLPDEAITQIGKFFRSVQSIPALQTLLHSDRAIRVLNRWTLSDD